jgi:aminoglycoside 6'-N-acetyltransferase I
LDFIRLFDDGCRGNGFDNDAYSGGCMEIEKVSRQNIELLTTLALELWPDCSFDEELTNGLRILGSETESLMLARERGDYVGFIQLSIRNDYVEGTTSGPVAYIEGLYVKPDFRGTGVGRMLVEAGERWGRMMGCRHYASDADLNNNESIKFHKKVGFDEANRIVCFTRKIR